MSLEVSTYEKKVFLVLSIFFFIISLIMIICIYTNHFDLINEHKKMFIYITIIFVSLGIIFLILYLVSKVISNSKTYDCINNKCVKNTKGDGKYSSLNECKNSGCGIPGPGPSSKTYDCSDNKCVENTKGNGAYLNLDDCNQSKCGQIAPGPGSKTYDCSDNICVENTEGNGKYSSIKDCQNAGCKKLDPKSNKPLILGYWENWNDVNYVQGYPDIGIPDESKFQQKTQYYTTINWSFVLLSKFWYGGYDPNSECTDYKKCGESACPACVNSDGTYINFPSDSLYAVPNCRKKYGPFISSSTTSYTLSNQLLSARETGRLARKYGKKFNISFGGWSDCVTLKDNDSNTTLAQLISNTILYTFSDGVDLDFEHFTQLSPLSYPNSPKLLYRTDSDADIQLQLFANLVYQIRTNLNSITTDVWNNTVSNYDKNLVNNKPDFTISFTCRYNSFITNDILEKTFGFTNNTSGEGLKIMGFDNNFIDNIDYVNLMIYDEANITSKIPYKTFYQKIVDLTINAKVPASKILCGVEPGKQAGAPVAPLEDSSIPDIGQIVLNQKLGGIFFWAINETNTIQNDFSSYLPQLYKSFGYKDN
jgi:GH18 family chitinase